MNRTRSGIAILSFTEKGRALAERLAAALGAAADCARGPEGASLASWTRAMFQTKQALVFVGAAGIAVRAVAPYLESKAKDPAVLVIDEAGRFIIPLLSGHLGGANDLARRIADLCGGTPVITTATDVCGVFAVDLWAKAQNMAIPDPVGIKRVSARLLAGEGVRLASDFPIAGEAPRGVSLLTENAGGPAGTPRDEADAIVSVRRAAAGERAPLFLVPRALVLGLGCRRGASPETIEDVWRRFCAETGVWPEAVYAAATIHHKAAEPGLLAFCNAHGWVLRSFSPEALRAVPGAFSASAFVAQTVGVDNVCERSAVRLAGGPLFAGKYAADGVTMALAIKPLCLDWRV